MKTRNLLLARFTMEGEATPHITFQDLNEYSYNIVQGEKASVKLAFRNMSGLTFTRHGHEVNVADWNNRSPLEWLAGKHHIHEVEGIASVQNVCSNDGGGIQLPADFVPEFIITDPLFSVLVVAPKGSVIHFKEGDTILQTTTL